MAQPQGETSYVGIAYDPVSTDIVGPASAVLTRSDGELRGEITVLDEAIPVDAGMWAQARSPDGPVNKYRAKHKGHILHLAAGIDGVGGRIGEHVFAETDRLDPTVAGIGFTVAISSDYTSDDIASGLQGVGNG